MAASTPKRQRVVGSKSFSEYLKALCIPSALLRKSSRRVSVADIFRSHKVHHVYRDSFHRAIYPVLLVAQFMGLMPVEGIGAANATFLHFKLQSIRTIYAFVFSLIGILFLLFEIYRVNTSDSATAKNLGIYWFFSFHFEIATQQQIFFFSAGCVFYGVTASGQLLFIYIARRWRHLMLIWAENESVFLKHPYYKAGRRLRHKIVWFGIFLLTVATIEHSLSRLSNFYSYNYEIRQCNLTAPSLIEFYAKKDFSHMFRFFPYHWLLGLFFYVRTIWGRMTILKIISFSFVMPW